MKFIGHKLKITIDGEELNDTPIGKIPAITLTGTLNLIEVEGPPRPFADLILEAAPYMASKFGYSLYLLTLPELERRILERYTPLVQ